MGSGDGMLAGFLLLGGACDPSLLGLAFGLPEGKTVLKCRGPKASLVAQETFAGCHVCAVRPEGVALNSCRPLGRGNPPTNRAPRGSLS